MERQEMLKMGEKATMKEEARSTGSGIWPAIKPFVNGFATGQMPFVLLGVVQLYFEGKRYRTEKRLGPDSLAVRNLNDLVIGNRELLYIGSRYAATNSTTLFGTFETLTKRAIEANGGSPITLYQEACCGLISGVTAAIISYPDWEFSMYSTIRKDGFLTLWKGACPTVARSAAFSTVMLASYGRSLKYFEESVGLSQTKAQIG